jgi:hypothetical protein
MRKDYEPAALLKFQAMRSSFTRILHLWAKKVINCSILKQKELTFVLQDRNMIVSYGIRGFAEIKPRYQSGIEPFSGFFDISRLERTPLHRMAAICSEIFCDF